MGIERLFSRGKNIALTGLVAFSFGACSISEPLVTNGKIELSEIPKEQVFEYVHYGKFSQEPKKIGDVVEKVEHRCDKGGNPEYCILKKTEFPDPHNYIYSGVNDEKYVITVIKDRERRLIFAKTLTGNPSINVGEFTETTYTPFGNSPDAKYLNKEFPSERWKDFMKNPTAPLEKFAPNKINEYREKYTQEQINTFNRLRFLPGLKSLVESLGYYLITPIRNTFSICCLD